MNPSWTIRKQTGAAAVEFAIILPLFLLIVFGIVEWSLYLFNDHIITNASRTGARTGIVQASPRIPIDPIPSQPIAIRPTVLNYSKSHLVTFDIPNDPIVQVSTNGIADEVCVAFQDELEVTVSYDYHFLLLPALTAGKVSPHTKITARTSMKCE